MNGGHPRQGPQPVQYGHPAPVPEPFPRNGQPQYGQAQYGQAQYGQAQYAQPQYGQPQYGGHPGAVAIDAKFFPLAWMFLFIKPKIVIDGREHPGEWGVNNIPLAPGQHHVHMHVPYVFPPKTGPADTVVAVQPGQATPLEYKAPMWTFSKGSLGQGPQQYNGLGAMLAVMGGTVAFCLLLILITVLGAG